MHNYKNNIVPGYKGIMDLDLSSISDHLKEDTINQHLNDIKNYRKEQSDLPERLRYENTIMYVNEVHRKDQLALQQRITEAQEKQRKDDADREAYYKRINDLRFIINQSK
jgi:hypothetical protein